MPEPGRGQAELAQRARLDLPDTLARDPELRSELFERLRRIAVEAEGPGIRVEFQDAGDEMFSRGDVLVSADAGETVYLLDNRKHRYSEIDLRALARITGRILKGVPGVFGLEIAEPRIEKLFEADGPEMLGQPTRHARYLMSYEERERLTTPAREAASRPGR